MQDFPTPCVEEMDTPEEKLRKWIIFADQYYFGARVSWLHGYNISALNQAQYALEHYFKALLSYKTVDWKKGKKGHDLCDLYKLTTDNKILEEVTDTELDALKYFQAYFSLRYPDCLPKAEMEWKFKITEFDSIVCKIRNKCVKEAALASINFGHDPIYNAQQKKEIFEPSMQERRKVMHHADIFNRYNKSETAFRAFHNKVVFLPLT